MKTSFWWTIGAIVAIAGLVGVLWYVANRSLPQTTPSSPDPVFVPRDATSTPQPINVPDNPDGKG